MAVLPSLKTNGNTAATTPQTKMSTIAGVRKQRNPSKLEFQNRFSNPLIAQRALEGLLNVVKSPAIRSQPLPAAAASSPPPLLAGGLHPNWAPRAQTNTPFSPGTPIHSTVPNSGLGPRPLTAAGNFPRQPAHDLQHQKSNFTSATFAPTHRSPTAARANPNRVQNIPTGATVDSFDFNAFGCDIVSPLLSFEHWPIGFNQLVYRQPVHQSQTTFPNQATSTVQQQRVAYQSPVVQQRQVAYQSPPAQQQQFAYQSPVVQQQQFVYQDPQLQLAQRQQLAQQQQLAQKQHLAQLLAQPKQLAPQNQLVHQHQLANPNQPPHQPQLVNPRKLVREQQPVPKPEANLSPQIVQQPTLEPAQRQRTETPVIDFTSDDSDHSDVEEIPTPPTPATEPSVKVARSPTPDTNEYWLNQFESIIKYNEETPYPTA